MTRIAPTTRVCRWPGCAKHVPAQLWGCYEHWKRIPAELQRALWLEYRPGQEADRALTSGYVDAERQIQHWIAAHCDKQRAEDAALEPQIKTYLEAKERAANRARVYRYRRSR